MRITFDRGTLLLLGLEDPGEASRIPGALWDPRVGRYRAPAWRYPEICSTLARTGIPVVDQVGLYEGCSATSQESSASPSNWTIPPLRPYQESALLAWRCAEDRGVLILPTGSGKTRVACAAMATLNLPTLCLVPTRALLHQWVGEIRGVYPGAVGCLGDGQRQVERVTVSTYESGFRQMDQVGGLFSLLVVDEVHHFEQGIRQELLELSAAPKRLGLTAIHDEGACPSRRSELVGPVVFRLGIGDLAGKFLSDYDLIVMQLGLSPEERRIYEEEIRLFQDAFRPFRQLFPSADWRQFCGAASRTREGRRALAAWRRVRSLLSFTRAKRRMTGELLVQHRDNRVIVFTADNEAAYSVAREHLVMPITCDISRKERERALQDFREGRLRVLVSSRVLNEGIDVPDADVAIVVGGHFGEREHLQRVGRLLRPRPGKRATVYELVTEDTNEVAQSEKRRRGLG